MLIQPQAKHTVWREGGRHAFSRLLRLLNFCDELAHKGMHFNAQHEKLALLLCSLTIMSSKR